MKLQSLELKTYEIPLTTGQIRSGFLIGITDEKGNIGWGEVAPLPKWSKESLDDALSEVKHKKDIICAIDWTKENCFVKLAALDLLPSVTFGLESALLSLLSPLTDHKVEMSALLMGSPAEILSQAKQRQSDGYQSAKLKVSNLNFGEAAELIHHLKDTFRLRIDVNRAWDTAESLQFFAQFPLNTFDYVEEPFRNPHDLVQFTHPLAVDESFPGDLSWEELEKLPTLKAMIYKPTIQGGMLNCLPVHAWAFQKGVQTVLSSSFESALGLRHIAQMARRLSITTPVGIGTVHFLSGNKHEFF